MRENILIIDDDPVIRTIIRLTLEEHSYRVEEAGNGEEGLLQVAKKKPDLILLDLVMPRMHGLGFISKLRANAKNFNIPIIFLTSQNSPHNRVTAFRVGADDFLAKPFEPEELFRSVEKVLKKIQEAKKKPTEIESANSSTFHGKLQEIGVASLLSLFETEQKTGILILNNLQKNEKIKLFIRQGRIVNIATEGLYNTDKKQIIYSLLTWYQGDFDFINCSVSIEDEIKASITTLLLEGCRVADESFRNGQ